MRGRFTEKLGKFASEPRLIALAASGGALPAIAQSVRDAIVAAWPACEIEELLDLRSLDDDGPGRRRDVVLYFADGAPAADVDWLGRAEARLDRRTALYVVAPDGSIARRLRRVNAPQAPALDVVAIIQNHFRGQARRRRSSYVIDRLRRKSGRLERLSLEDPLTGVFNRRGFYRFLHAEWSRASRHDADLACVMIDIDRFKRLNDTYGHKIGDQILRHFARVLRASCRASDILGRVGGEEFCVILPSCNEHQAFLWAEKLRRRVSHALLKAGEKSLRVTASFGVAASATQLHDEHELIDLADQAMLVAKYGGRNRVTRASALSGKSVAESRVSPSSRVVRVLLDSLALRDPATHQHSHRVAQFATLLAKHVGLSENEVWIAEVAGLLHDIGKLGLPNSVLQKADKLDERERELVHKSLETSYDIARSAFGEGPLAETIKASRMWIRDAAEQGDGRLPISARILAIADAFDAMTSAAPYRPPLSRAAAIAELNRFAGVQFDSDLVREFVGLVEESLN